MAPPRIISEDDIAQASRRIAAGQPWREAAADIPMSLGALVKRVKRYRRDNPGSEISDKSGIAAAASTPPQSGHESTVLSTGATNPDERLLLTDPELPRAPLRTVVHDTRIESAREQRARTGGSSSSGGSRPIQRHPEGGRVRKVFTTGTDSGNGWQTSRRAATDGTPAHYLDRFDARNPKGTEMRLRDARGFEKGRDWFTVESAIRLRAEGWEWCGGLELPNPWDIADEYGNVQCDCGQTFPSQGALLRHRDLHHVAA